MDALRSLVDAEQIADAVAGAVVVVQSLVPERAAGEKVKVLPRHARAEARGGEGEAAGQSVEGFSVEQVETARRMHDELLAHPEERITIEDLAHKYLMNPTTLKDVFKAVYGESIASHMKEHRMEKAAELLRETELSIAAVAEAVGYDSAGKFSSAFRERYHLLPSEYRKAQK